MIGPAVEAVIEWLVTRRIPSSTAEPSVDPSGASTTSLEYLMSMFQAMTGPLNSRESQADEYSASIADEYSPAALSCGVMLHLFLSSQQDGCMHEKGTVADAEVSDGNKSSSRWINKVSKKARENNIHAFGS